MEHTSFFVKGEIKMQWEGLRHLAGFEKEKESVICAYFSLSLCHFFSSLTCEKKFMILPIKTNAARPVSAVHITVLLKKKKKYYVPQQKQCWMIPTADNAQWWRLSRPWPVTLVLPQNLGFKKSQQRGIGWEKESKQQKDSFAFNKWYLHSVKTSFTKHWF